MPLRKLRQQSRSENSTLGRLQLIKRSFSGSGTSQDGLMGMPDVLMAPPTTTTTTIKAIVDDISHVGV